MATKGRSIPRAIGVGVSFSQNNLGAGSTQNFNLDPGLYQLVVQMCDPAIPGSITITDPNGQALTFQQHGEYRYAAMGQFATGTTYTLTCTGGVDFVALTLIGNRIGTDGAPEVFASGF
jgi:hypothetical protein